MIRRWSCLNTIDLDIKSFLNFNKVQRKKIFRSSVRFKRYRFAGTKFKRRQFRKLKHYTIWPLYYNVFRYWTHAVRFSKQQARYQYNYRFFVNNCTVVESNPIASQLNKIYATADQWVTAAVTRKMFKSFGKGNNNQVVHSHKSLHHTIAFFPFPEIKGNLATTPGLAVFEKQFFAKSYEIEMLKFDIFISEVWFESLLFEQHKEINKILILLFINKILKITKNVHSSRIIQSTFYFCCFETRV